MSLQGNINIKYLSIGKAQDLKEIGELSIQSVPEWVKDCKKIFENYCSSNLDAKIDQRNKVRIKDTNNNYYFYISESYNFFIAVVDSSYPESLVFKLFDDIYKENIPLLRDDKGRLNSIGISKLKGIVNSFQTAQRDSKINEINSDINEIKKDMKENVKKVIGNVEDANELKDRSDKIAEASKQFQKNASDIKKQSCIQNFKWWIIIGLIVAVVILIIVLAVVPSSSSENTDKSIKNEASSQSSASVNVSVKNRFL